MCVKFVKWKIILLVCAHQNVTQESQQVNHRFLIHYALNKCHFNNKKDRDRVMHTCVNRL